MKVEVYTALYGGYEIPKPIQVSVPAYLYTDDETLTCPGWDVQCRPLLDIPTPMLQAKWWKTHPQDACPRADVSIYLDASITVLVPDFIELCLAALGEDDWAMVTHPARSCIYTEAHFSAALGRYQGADLAAQADFYRGVVGHPANWGLFATGLNIRRHTDVVAEVSDQWWWECTSRTWQDQVSLPVLIRLAENRLKWNQNLPWGQWWSTTGH